MPPKKAADKDAKDDDKEKDKSEAEVQLSMLVASTFANDELASKTATLQQYYQLCARLKEENDRLREEMVERDRDSLQVVEFLRREVEKKQEIVENLKVQTDQQREKASESLRDREDELMTVVAQKEQLLGEKDEVIKRLEQDLESVSRFKRSKHEMEDLVAKLRQTIADTKDKYEKELSRLRFQSLEEKVRLKHEEKDLNEKFAHAVNQKAMELLDGQTRQIHSENTELRVSYYKLEKEYMQLSKQSKALEEEKKRKEQEIELSKHSLDEYSKQSYRSHKEIKDLTVRNRALEANASALVQKYEADKHNVILSKTEELDTLSESLKDTQQALRVRSLELHRIKRLARVIIQQRSELELFFTEALEYVRQEIQNDRLARQSQPYHTERGGTRRESAKLALTHAGASAQRKYGRRGSGSRKGQPQGVSGTTLGSNFRPILQDDPASLPPLSNGPGSDLGASGGGGAAVSPYPEGPDSSVAPSPQPASEASRVDITELSWADKERVLRILFAKISQGSKSADATGTAGAARRIGTPLEGSQCASEAGGPIDGQGLLEDLRRPDGDDTFVTQKEHIVSAQ